MGRYLDIARRTASTPSRVTALREQASRASTWDELYIVLDESQAAYDAGEITSEEAESLVGCVVDRSRQVPECDESEDGTLSDLLVRLSVIRVRSLLLGEVVVWLADGAETPPGTSEVVYREAELRQLVGMAPEQVRAVHVVKRSLDGEIVE